MVPYRVIVVDDSPLFLAAACRLVESLPDFEVVGECSSAEDGLAMAAKLRPDVVLMDVEMPGMDGLSASRSLSEETWRPSVLLMTVHDPPHYRAAASRAGADGLIGKSDLGLELEPMLLGLLEKRAGGPKKFS
jgi:DNA-binding NarL/FixJ family response regulator